MSISSCRIASILAFVALFAAGTASAAIITNGDFETPGHLTGWTRVVNAGTGGPFADSITSTSSGPWDNGLTSVLGSGGNVAYVEVYQTQVTSESIEQTVSLVGGLTYHVTYEENARQNQITGGALPLVELFLGGTSVVAQHSVSPVDAASTFSNPFHAMTSSTFTPSTSGSYVIEFRVNEVGTTHDQTALFDNIAIAQVVAVPEPASCALLGIGTCAMLAVRRRRHSH